MAFSALEPLRPVRPISVVVLSGLLISAGALDFTLLIVLAFSGQPSSTAYTILLVTDIIGIRSIIIGIGFFLGFRRLLVISFISSLLSLVFILLILALRLIPAIFPDNPLPEAAEVVGLILTISFLVGAPLAGVPNFFAQMDALRRLSAPASFADQASALLQALNAASQGMQPLLIFRPRGVTVLAALFLIAGAVAIIGGAGPLVLQFIASIQSLSVRAELTGAGVVVLALGALQIVTSILLLQMRSMAWSEAIAASAVTLAYSPIGAVLALLPLSALSDVTAKALLGTNFAWAVFLAFPIGVAGILYLTSRRLRLLFGKPTVNDLNTIRILGPNLAALAFGITPIGLNTRFTLPRFL